jgi:hypothetical protein
VGFGQHGSRAATPLQPLWLNPRLTAVRQFAFERRESAGADGDEEKTHEYA